ncbi:MAG: hypothetical protein VYA60_04715 [Pseudomonadota bacterium]|nr:hypothetical protein [Pseudomonadota bacterium]
MRRNERNQRKAIKQSNKLEVNNLKDQNISSQLKPTEKKTGKNHGALRRIRFIPFQTFNVVSIMILAGMAVALLMLAASSTDSNAGINAILGPNIIEFVFWVFAALGLSLPFTSYFLVKSNDT